MNRILLLSFSLSAILGLAFAAEPPKFPEPYDSEKSPDKPQPAAEAAKGFKMPPGFKVEVFASEPDVRNPIACCWDTKGRFWVAENYTYAESQKKFDLTLKDRVIIFHDKDGDGKPDERKVFIDTVQRLTSVEVGLGGVWLMCPPQLLFVPDRNGDDIPDGPPEVVLEGFDVPTDNYHNFANGLKWGPDGWLYGRCGASAPGNVRRPDQGPQDAVPLTGGVWRYHPHRKVFEALCHGTTNPWGHDWDAFGECFFVNSVNGHLWHMIPGAHYRRPHTISPNPLVYEPMEMIADHWHFDTGKGWTASRKVDASVDALGGGHAHAGCLIYNGDNWPKEYRGKLLTCNLHGRRINVEKLERQGSGYVGKREPDIFQASDPFFRGMDLSQGPDGSVYVLDWSDTGECHDHTGVLRSTGRIYRITYGNSEHEVKSSNLTLLSLEDLCECQRSDNSWFVSQSRRELCNRAASGTDMQDARKLLSSYSISNHKIWRNNADFTRHAIEDRRDKILAMLLIGEWDNVHRENKRITIIKNATDDWPINTVTGSAREQQNDVENEVVKLFVNLARSEPLPSVRLAIASKIQRMSTANRIAISNELCLHGEDANDPNIPFMIWYGLIPVALQTPEKLVDLAGTAKIPLVRKWTARRFAEIIAEKPNCLSDLLAKTADKDEATRRDVVQGISEGLAGIRKATPPAAWKTYPKTFADAKLNDKVRTIDVVFGDGRALDEVKKLALDDKADLEQRKAAVRSLIDANPPELRSLCESLLRVRFVNTIAIKGLAKYDDAGPAILKAWKSFHPSERPLVIDALCSRPSFAAALLDEIGKGNMTRGEISAGQARTIRGYDKPELTAKLTAVWGEFRESSKDKQDLIGKLKTELTAEVLKSADKSAGRAIFAKTCASCHKLYGAGEAIGPDLTGAGRKDMDYLLGNIVDPSAIVTKDFQMTKFTMTDGRVLNGIVVSTAPKTITVQMEKEKVTLAKDEIENQKQSTQSLMPDGLLQTLSPTEVRNLFSYLQSDSQVP